MDQQKIENAVNSMTSDQREVLETFANRSVDVAATLVLAMDGFRFFMDYHKNGKSTATETLHQLEAAFILPSMMVDSLMANDTEGILHEAFMKQKVALREAIEQLDL